MMNLNQLKYLCVLFIFVSLGCKSSSDSCEGPNCEKKSEKNSSSDKSNLNMTPDSKSASESSSTPTDTVDSENKEDISQQTLDNWTQTYFIITNKLPSSNYYHIEIKVENKPPLQLTSGACVRIHNDLLFSTVAVIVSDQDVYQLCIALADQATNQAADYIVENKNGKVEHSCLERSSFGSHPAVHYKIESERYITQDTEEIPRHCNHVIIPNNT